MSEKPQSLNEGRLLMKLQGIDQYIDNIQFERDFTKNEREFLIKLMEENEV